MTVDTLGRLLALRVTPANENNRAAMATLADAVQDATGEAIELTSGRSICEAAPGLAARGRGFVLLPSDPRTCARSRDGSSASSSMVRCAEWPVSHRTGYRQTYPVAQPDIPFTTEAISFCCRNKPGDTASLAAAIQAPL